MSYIVGGMYCSIYNNLTKKQVLSFLKDDISYICRIIDNNKDIMLDDNVYYVYVCTMSTSDIINRFPLDDDDIEICRYFNEKKRKIDCYDPTEFVLSEYSTYGIPIYKPI